MKVTVTSRNHLSLIQYIHSDRAMLRGAWYYHGK